MTRQQTGQQKGDAGPDAAALVRYFDDKPG